MSGNARMLEEEMIQNIRDKKIKPSAHIKEGLIENRTPCKVPNHLNTLIPVGTAIIIVAEVKYARVSASIPTVNI